MSGTQSSAVVEKEKKTVMNSNEQVVRSFLRRELLSAEGSIEQVPVFSKRYNDAVDRAEEVEAAMEALDAALISRAGGAR